MKTTKRKPAWILYKTGPSQYERYVNLHIELLAPEYSESWVRRAEFNWQAHFVSYHNDGPSEWYAFLVEICSGSFGALDEANKLIHAVRKAHGDGLWTPQAIIETLHRLKWPQVVYDARLSKYLPVGEVLGPEYERWVADFNDDGELGYVLATNADDALRQLKRHALREETWSGAEARINALARWKELGFPVTTANLKWSINDRAPDVTPWGKVILSPKEEAEAKVAAAKAEAAKAEAAKYEEAAA